MLERMDQPGMVGAILLVVDTCWTGKLKAPTPADEALECALQLFAVTSNVTTPAIDFFQHQTTSQAQRFLPQQHDSRAV
jgi:hypothetical protein